MTFMNVKSEHLITRKIEVYKKHLTNTQIYYYKQKYKVLQSKIENFTASFKKSVIKEGLKSYL